MNFGICTLSVIPCRKEPSSTSEMVTQLLFGETYTIIEDKEDWLNITTNFDHYPCWISAKQHTCLTQTEFKNLTIQTLSSELVQVISNTSSKAVFPITIGASLPNFKDNKVIIGDISYCFEGQTTDITQNKSIEDLKQTAYVFLNAPYLWGGRSPFGIDCWDLHK